MYVCLDGSKGRREMSGGGEEKFVSTATAASIISFRHIINTMLSSQSSTSVRRVHPAAYYHHHHHHLIELSEHLGCPSGEEHDCCPIGLEKQVVYGICPQPTFFNLSKRYIFLSLFNCCIVFFLLTYFLALFDFVVFIC